MWGFADNPARGCLVKTALSVGSSTLWVGNVWMVFFRASVLVWGSSVFFFWPTVFSELKLHVSKDWVRERRPLTISVSYVLACCRWPPASLRQAKAAGGNEKARAADDADDKKVAGKTTNALSEKAAATPVPDAPSATAVDTSGERLSGGVRAKAPDTVRAGTESKSATTSPTDDATKSKEGAAPAPAPGAVGAAVEAKTSVASKDGGVKPPADVTGAKTAAAATAAAAAAASASSSATTSPSGASAPAAADGQTTVSGEEAPETKKPQSGGVAPDVKASGKIPVEAAAAAAAATPQAKSPPKAPEVSLPKSPSKDAAKPDSVSVPASAASGVAAATTAASADTAGKEVRTGCWIPWFEVLKATLEREDAGPSRSVGHDSHAPVASM